MSVLCLLSKPLYVYSFSSLAALEGSSNTRLDKSGERNQSLPIWDSGFWATPAVAPVRIGWLIPTGQALGPPSDTRTHWGRSAPLQTSASLAACSPNALSHEAQPSKHQLGQEQPHTLNSIFWISPGSGHGKSSPC